MNVIGVKWVYNMQTTLERLKARPVAKGYNQLEGVAFSETFSPVVKPVTAWLVLSLATIREWKVPQMDVKNAFLLNGVLGNRIYSPTSWLHT